MNLAPILPELILTVGAIVLMMVAAFLGRRGSSLCTWASVALLLGSAVTLLGEPQSAGALFGGQLEADGFGAFGKLDKPDVAAMRDLNLRELGMLGSIALGVMWMGVYPESFMAPMRKDVQVLLARVERARPPGDAQLALGAPKPPAAEAHVEAGGH